MRIQKINFIPPLVTDTKYNTANSVQVSENPLNSKSYKMFAYQDYNVTFGGRTPEDFYAQDFNRNNMPSTMKAYLNYDYEQRQHIPPEQMMSEVFKYLEIADNFEEVKSLYPNEELFKNLHPSKLNARKTVLSEIKAARELSDAPLLKDGSDNFGMYLLKKIYLEGKTIKEISKDFLEKDLNDEYKGLITEPIGYATTAAFGIEFPNRSFWHSFINTRDEYKKFFVTLPKNSYIPGVNAPRTSSGSSASKGSINSEDTPKPAPKRKYQLNKERKHRIKKDLIENAKNGLDVDSVKKTVRKRFRKDDPEASFIVKYMSPIMTVAADRIHLSEEMKAFTENERENGKSSNEKTMFERFWKQNPYLLEEYSTAITDTIEMFEDNYGAGGMIPINCDFEPITSKTKNQKAIDYVTPEYIELLNFTKTIEPARNLRYEEHDKMQLQWNEHFVERYGAPNTIISAPEAPSEIEEEQQPIDQMELMKEIAKKNNAEIIEFNAIDGSHVYITTNVNESYKELLQNSSKIYPSKFANLYIKSLSSDQSVSDKFKLTAITTQLWDKIDDDKIMSANEFEEENRSLNMAFGLEHLFECYASSFAMLDLLFSLKDSKDIPVEFNKLSILEFSSMLDGTDGAKSLEKLFLSHKKELNALYDSYTKPFSQAEKNKVVLQMQEQLMNYNPDKSLLDDNSKEVILMLKEGCKMAKFKRNLWRDHINRIIDDYPFAKTLLNKNLTKEHKQAKFELLINTIISDMIHNDCADPIFGTINREIYNAHAHNLTSDIQQGFEQIISNLDYSYKAAFETSSENIKRQDEILYSK